jgi:peptidoglycan hydrolase-like protein with peptidoglycan-binding domain
MDVVSDKRITGLEATQGTTRVYSLEDGSWLKASGGTVAWRNNNPGNMKFGFKDSADHTVHTSRTREHALHDAQARYQGVVSLDQWGNAVFESYEAGRKAQEKMLTHNMGDKTVEELVKAYSTKDYSGTPHHQAQIATIYATAKAEGVDLHGKKVQDMTGRELDALADGLSKAEGWKAGKVEHMPPMSQDDLHKMLHQPEHQTTANPAEHHAAPKAAEHHAAPATEHHASPKAAEHHAAAKPVEHHAAKAAPHPVYHAGDHSQGIKQMQEHLNQLGVHSADGKALQADQKFGQHTKEAVESFQRAHGLKPDGIAGEKTLGAIATAIDQQHAAKAHAPQLNDAAHPANHIYRQAYNQVSQLDAQHGRESGPHTAAFSGALTAAAVNAGMNRIDNVMLSDDGKQGYAVQGDLNSPFKQHAQVDVMQAIQTPLAQSSAQAMNSPQAVAQPAPQQAQQLSQQAAQPVPGMAHH